MWKACSAIEAEALEAWRQDHAPGERLELALATHINCVDIGISRKFGGNITVTVSLIGHRPRHCGVYFFRLQRAGNKVYRTDQIGSTQR